MFGVSQSGCFSKSGLTAFVSVPRCAATEAEITLSFDHRFCDGGAAGRLLKRVAELLQRPEDL